MANVALFDFDGTLVRTDGIHRQCWNIALEPYAIEVTMDFYTSYFVGVHSLPVAEYFIRKYEKIDITAAALAERKDMIFDEYIKQFSVQLMPGAREILAMMRRNQFVIGIVSGSPARSIKKILSDQELLQYFKVIVAREHIEEGKPSPEGYQIAIDALKADRMHTFSFEDTKSGVLAARAARIIPFAISQPLTLHHDFSSADFLCKDLFDVMNILNYE